MEKTQHFFENNIYLVSNRSVARNSLFINEELQSFFIDRMEHHLNPICNVLGYSCNKDEFQILVKLKGRQDFIDHFFTKKKNRELDLAVAPDTTYIFSQAMSNFQVSFVKYYNYVSGRSGSLMAGRFERKLIESGKEVKMILEGLNSGRKKRSYASKWADQTVGADMVFTSAWLYEASDSVRREQKSIYEKIDLDNLGGYFKSLPPKKIADPKRYFTLRFNQLFGSNPGQYY